MGIFLRPKTEPFRRLGPPESDVVLEVLMVVDEAKKFDAPIPVQLGGGALIFVLMLVDGVRWQIAMSILLAVELTVWAYVHWAKYRSGSTQKKIVVTSDAIWWPSYGRRWLGRPLSEIKLANAVIENVDSIAASRRVDIEFDTTRVTQRFSMSLEGSERLLRAITEFRRKNV